MPTPPPPPEVPLVGTGKWVFCRCHKCEALPDGGKWVPGHRRNRHLSQHGCQPGNDPRRSWSRMPRDNGVDGKFELRKAAPRDGLPVMPPSQSSAPRQSAATTSGPSRSRRSNHSNRWATSFPQPLRFVPYIPRQSDQPPDPVSHSGLLPREIPRPAISVTSTGPNPSRSAQTGHIEHSYTNSWSPPLWQRGPSTIYDIDGQMDPQPASEDGMSQIGYDEADPEELDCSSESYLPNFNNELDAVLEIMAPAFQNEGMMLEEQEQEEEGAEEDMDYGLHTSRATGPGQQSADPNRRFNPIPDFNSHCKFLLDGGSSLQQELARASAYIKSDLWQMRELPRHDEFVRICGRLNISHEELSTAFATTAPSPPPVPSAHGSGSQVQGTIISNQHSVSFPPGHGNSAEGPSTSQPTTDPPITLRRTTEGLPSIAIDIVGLLSSYHLSYEVTSGILKVLEGHLGPMPTAKVLNRYIKAQSNVNLARYHNCIHCSILFPDDENIDKCPQCNAERFVEVKSTTDQGVKTVRKPVSEYLYLPIIPRLEAQFQVKKRIDELMYRARRATDSDSMSDVFDGELYKHLKSHGYFAQETDIALALTLDGFRVFKNGRQCWVFVLINLNLSPEIRTKRENMILVGITPGAKSPKDFDPYLAPLFEELQKLAKGVEARMTLQNGTLTTFTLRAHLICCTGDMPAINKLLKMKGHTAIFGCRFCFVEGVKLGGVCYFKLDGNKQRLVSDYLFTWLQSPSSIDDGIKGRPLLTFLETIPAPMSFPIDPMHAISNVATLMYGIWSGTIKIPAGYPFDDREKDTFAKALGAMMETIYIPSSDGATPKNIYKEHGGLITEAWQDWIVMYSLPLLKCAGLPDEHLKGWSYFVEAIRLLLQLKITKMQRLLIAVYLFKFYAYYARSLARLTGAEEDNHEGIKLMRMCIHQLLHIPKCLELLGSLRQLWQYPLERMGGQMMRAIMSRLRPIENMMQRELISEGLKTLSSYGSTSPSHFGPDSQEEVRGPESNIPASEHGADVKLEGRLGTFDLDDNLTNQLQAAYARRQHAKNPTLAGLQYALELVRQEWSSARPFVEAWSSVVRCDMILGSSSSPRGTSQRRRNDVVKATSGQVSWNTLALSQAYRPLRHYQVDRFIRHSFRGETLLWACVTVPEIDSALGSFESGYKRCPMTRSFRFKKAVSDRRMIVGIDEIIGPVGFFKHGEELYIMDDGDMSNYIQNESDLSGLTLLAGDASQQRS